jgi:hypothetical protein
MTSYFLLVHSLISVEKPPVSGGQYVETPKSMGNSAQKLKIFLHGHDKSVVVERSAGNSVEYTADLSNRACGEKWDFPFFHRTVESLSTPSAGLAGAKKGDL